MKRFSVLIVACLALLGLSGCDQYGGVISMAIGDHVSNFDNGNMSHEQEHGTIAASEAIETLEFSSLDEFLLNFSTVKAGRATVDFANSATNTGFAALERLYLPTNIPEAYQLFRITVNEEAVSIWYLPEEYLGSEDAIWFAISQQRHFLFSFTRWNIESPMDGILRQNRSTEEDLIDGKYLFIEPNMFIWGSDSEVVTVCTYAATR